MSTPFSAAIEILGSQKRMAEVCGVSQQLVSVYVVEGRLPKAEWALPIERATREAGQEVSRYELRPDLYGAKQPQAAE